MSKVDFCRKSCNTIFASKQNQNHFKYMPHVPQTDLIDANSFGTAQVINWKFENTFEMT